MRRILGLFTHNWKLKVFSLLISVGLFYFVRNDKDTEGTLVVEIQYTNPPEGQVLLNELVRSVKLGIRGPWMGVRKFDGETYRDKLVVDLSRIRGDRYDLDPTLFQLPKGIRVTSIMPQYLPVRMEQRLERTVPVTLKIDSNRNFTVTETALEPSKIKLAGPKSVVLSFPTLPLPPYAVTREGTQEFTLELPELPSSLQMTPAVKEVRVRVVVEKAITSRQFSRIPVTVRGYKGKYSLEPKTVDVTVEGSRKGLANLTPASIVPYIEVGRKPAEKELYLPILLQKLPAEFHTRVMPTQIKIKLLP